MKYPQSLKNKQNPKKILIICSDSRESETKYTDWKFKPGKIFVIRNAGNCALFDDALACIHYALLHLKIKTLEIGGHYNCGMMKALLEKNHNDQYISSAVKFIKKNIFNNQLPSKDENQLAKENIHRQIEILLKKDKLVKKLVSRNNLQVIGSYFDFNLKATKISLINKNGKVLIK